MKPMIAVVALLIACDAAPDPSKYPPPVVTCTSSPTDCAPPPAGCADQHWMYYYDDGQCEKNQCKWTTKFFECRGGDNCAGNRCYYDGETAPYTYGP